MTVEADGATEQFKAEAVMVGGVTYLRIGEDGAWSDVTAEAAALPMPENPFVGLDERRLTFMGRTEDGLYEFDINVWILGDTVDRFDIDSGLPTTGFGVGTFTNRVFVDEAGTPYRLTSRFAFTEYETWMPGEATLSIEFSGFGEPISIEKPLLGQET
jgi:hypothetical protein